MNDIREIIEDAVKRLRDREKAKDQTMGRAHQVRMLSKRAILHLHNLDPAAADSRLQEAGRLLAEIVTYTAELPEMEFYEGVEAARQEYAEAKILHGLNTGAGYPSPAALSISETDYIMGLADVPGELRRQSLDLIRAGRLDKAEDNLREMEEIYMGLVEADEASLLLKGLRRKIDVARAVNERTRSEITEEVSRAKLSEELKRLRDRLG